MTLVIIYSCYLVFMSLVAFFLFLKDKGMAKKNGNAVRIKEKTLLGCVALGVAIGGFIGRIVAHHKTEKFYFSVTIYFSLLLQLAVLGCMIYLAVR